MKTTIKSTKPELRLEDVSAVNDLLNEIWRLGDKDEMSIKHIGHGLAALITWGDWKKGYDYNLPNVRMTKFKLERLANAWQQVKEYLHGVSNSECLEMLDQIGVATYANIYLDVFGDYYTKPSDCLHDYGVEKGVSFCLSCGEFEDNLKRTNKGAGN